MTEEESDQMTDQLPLPYPDSGSSFFRTYSEFRSRRLDFSKEEDQEILDWIFRNQSFRLLNGNAIWKRMACTMVLGRSWQSLKERFLNHISCNLTEYKLSRPEIWRIKEALGVLDAKKLLCDTDMDDEDDEDNDGKEVGKEGKLLKKRRSHDSCREQRNTDEESIDAVCSKNRKKIRRKHSLSPADSLDGSHRMNNPKNNDTSSSSDVHSSTSTSNIDKLAIHSNKEQFEQVGNDEDLNLLLNNTDLLPKLRGSTSADSFASPCPSVPSGKETSNIHDEMSLAAIDVPSVEKFSAGLRQVSSRMMSNDEELSIMGVTSTIRPDEDEDDNNSQNNTRPEFGENDLSRNLHLLGNSPGHGVNNNSNIPPTSPSNNNSVVVSNLEDSNHDEIRMKTPMKLKKIEAQIGFGSENEIFLVVKGLPSNIDPNNVELVKTTSKQNLNDPHDETVGVNDRNATTKLKVISLCNDVDSSQNKNWRKEGGYRERFRTPYAKKEDLAIINFVKQRQGARNEIGGNRMWRILEERNVCPGRSWESMRERWRSFISGNLTQFNVTEDQVLGEK